jgi:hypothetical protein
MAQQPVDYTKIPGQVKVTITPFEKDDPRFQSMGDDGKLHPMGYLLADLQKRAVNAMLEWAEPIHHEKSIIPLKIFLERYDPLNTYLNFSYEFTPDPEFVRNNPDLFPSPKDFTRRPQEKDEGIKKI